MIYKLNKTHFNIVLIKKTNLHGGRSPPQTATSSYITKIPYLRKNNGD